MYFHYVFSFSSIVVTVNSNRLISLDKLVSYRTAGAACFLIYINWAVGTSNWPLFCQIPTLVMFQAKGLVCMIVVTGLTPTSQEVRGSPAVSHG